MTVLLIAALVVASVLAARRWGLPISTSPRDQVDAFTRARTMTRTWSEDPQTTPEPLRDFLAQQHRPDEGDAAREE